jgi:hypothetical protein
MIRELVFRTQAQDEYRDAFSWYEDQQEGLGSKFEREIQSILEAIQKLPARYP